MIKKYVHDLLGENTNEIEKLELSLSMLKRKLEENRNLLNILKLEANVDSEIFTPRNHRDQNKEKINEMQSKIETIEQEIERKETLLNESQTKKKEYNEMLMEIDMLSPEEKAEKIRSDIHTAIQNGVMKNMGEETGAAIEDADINCELRKDDRTDGTNLKDTMINGNGRNGNHEAESDDWDDMNYGNDFPEKMEIRSEIKAEEVIILESERKKEKEFLNQIYKKVELCMALTSSDRNMCRNELKSVKKMIRDYVDRLDG